MTQEEIETIANDEQNELAQEAFKAAVELDIWSWDSTNPFAPPGKFAALRLNRDIHDGSMTIPAGAYYLPLDSNGAIEINELLHIAVFDNSLVVESDEPLDMVGGDEPIKATVRVQYRPLNLNLGMLSVLAAAEYAEDDDLRSRLLKAFVESNEVQKIASFPVKTSFSDHGLPMKLLSNGTLDIAMGKPFSEIGTKKGLERYKLTGSLDACSNYYAAGGSGGILEAVVSAVYSLMLDSEAADFESGGRVWFTTNKIFQEMSRTQGGALVGNKYPQNAKLVDLALLALSGLQIVGTKKDGSPTDVLYYIDALRRDTVTYAGKTYRDVWGFAVAGKQTTSAYAIDQRRAYFYPLLDRPSPKTLEEMDVEGYLKDALNELRSKLYTTNKNGKVVPRSKVKRWQVERSWNQIFEQIKPLSEMSSRQKRGAVERCQSMLSDLAKMDAAGELRKDAPMLINAYSVRNAAKGRGGGAWVKLVIEGTSKFEVGVDVPKIDLF